MATDTSWLLLLVALVLPLVVLLARRRRSGGGSRCIPPGPLAVPVLGSLLWLRHSSANLEPLLQRLIARYGPVVSLRVGSRLSIFVADRRVAHAALVERGAALADRPDVTRSLLGETGNTITRSSYGPVWRVLRRNLVAETLHPSRVRLFAPARSWVRRVLVDKLADGACPESEPPRPRVVVETFRYAMFCLLVLMCFGERLDEAAVRAIGAVQRDWLLYVARKTSVFAFYPAVTKHIFRRRLQMGLALRRRQKELFVPLIDARRARKNHIQQAGGPPVPEKETTFEHSYVDTLLDVSLPDTDGDRALTEDELVMLSSEFLNAGTDTTATALQWIMAELVKNPSIQSKLHDEIKSKTSDGDDHDEITEEDTHDMPYLKAVILEGLRKHPPAHFVLPHKMAEDTEVGGYLIPKGATVNFMVAEMGRDEREWEKPMEFIPERFLAGGDGEGVDVTGSREVRMMPFGVGRRICAGLGVAMLHLEYFVANLVKEFEWKEVAGDEVDLTEKNEFTTVMAKPLRAQLWHLLLIAFLLIPPFLLLLSLRGGVDGKRKCSRRVPPGPLAVPVLGNLLWLSHSSADLEPLLRRLIAVYGPVVSLRVGSRLSIFVADRRVAHAALVEHGAALADRMEVARALVGENGNTIARASYGPTWRLLRRNLVSGTLHPSTPRARALLGAPRARRQAGGGAPHGVMDTLQYAMFCLLVVMCFGERLDEADVRAIAAAQHEWILYYATKMTVFASCSTVTKHLFRGRIKMALALRRRQKELFMPLINARRERKTRTQPTLPESDTTFEHSYVDTLLDLRLPEDDNRALTDKEMVSLCSEFLDAGTDTMSTALQWIMAELVKNPSIQAKLHDEIKATVGDDHEGVGEEDTQKMPYLKAVILEGLRKHPPGHFVLAHKAAEDIEVGGYLIPKGATVNFMVAEMGRDEREWENPMQFMPERFLPGGDGEGVDITGSKRIRMMPFGVGRRMCAGINTAMLHLEYFVANMVREFEWKAVAGDEVDFAEKFEFTTVMAKPLRAQLERDAIAMANVDASQWLLLLVAFLVALFILLSLRGGGERKCGGRSRVPPGPLAVPVLGNLLWLSHSSADLEPLLRRLIAVYGPVVSLRVGSHLSIFVADRRVAHAALVERGAALADRPEVTRALLGENGNTITRGNYGPTWRLLRRNLVAETLHPSRARAAFAPARSWARRALVDGLVGGGAVLADAFRHAMFCLLVLMCFGEWLDEAAVRAIGDAQHGWLLHYATKMKVFAFCPAVTKHIFRGRIQTSLALRRRQKELLMPLINARRERKNQLAERAVPEKETTTFEHSYVDTLLDIKIPEDGGDRALTDDEMVRLCSEFLDAGTDTMSTTLQWIMAELVKNSTIQSKLHDEIKATVSDDHDEITEEDTQKMPYLKSVILEGLRKHPPGHFALPHKAAEDMDVGGYLIPKGATVNFMVAEMGRDEREWENPMQFMPERFLPGGDGEGVDVTGSKGIRMMPFGVGRRICAGLNTAMLHLEYFVANMVREFEWREIAGEEVDFAEKVEFTTVMAKPLRAQLGGGCRLDEGVAVGELDGDGHAVEDLHGARGEEVEGVGGRGGVGAGGEEGLGAAEEGPGEDDDGGGAVPGGGVLGAGEVGEHAGGRLEEGHAGEDGGAVVGDGDGLEEEEIILSMPRGPREVRAAAATARPAAMLRPRTSSRRLVSVRRRRLPPGPPAVPLFGNLLWLRHSAADVEPLLLKLFDKYGPVVTLRIGWRLSIFVADRHLAHVAPVGAGAKLADRPRTATSMLLGVSENIITRSNYGAMWRLLRRNLVSQTLQPSRVDQFAPARVWARRVLMEKLRETTSGGGGGGDEPNVMEAFQHAVFCLLLLMCFGERLDEPAVRAVEDADRAWLLYISKKTSVFFFLPWITKHLFRGRLEAGHALLRRQKELFMPLIEARREYKKLASQGLPPARETTLQHSYVDTLLDVKIPEEGNRSLTDGEIVTLCSEFLNAGTDTTSTGLQWIMAELVKNPAVQEKLHAEINATCGDDGELLERSVRDKDNKMPYLNAVVMEGLRKHPPSHTLLPHKAAEDMDVGRYLIPKGATVNFMVAEIGRDEREWEKPMEFIPERFLAGGDGDGVDVTGSREIRMMPFGAGRRICAGLNVGVMHLEYLVGSMVMEFEWKEVAGDEVEFAEKLEFTTAMAKPLRPRLL
uniref:Cytochrome P450 n=1 Tax=Oryza meridionalis TaxID=40149 RepID=A0A0E0EZV6_9ORYZ